MRNAMKYVLPENPYRKKMLLRYLLFGLIGIAAPLSSFAADVHSNLGLGLKQLVENYQNDQTLFRAKISDAKTVQADSADRVIVNIHLDGTKRVEDVAGDLEDLGLEIIAIDPNWRSGVVSAWLPISQATAVAQLAGVRSVMLAPPPRKRVGSVTAESAVVEHTQQVNTPGLYTSAGILGNGITIGIVSDSYDTASGVPRASVGVSSKDLPGTGNPDYPTPVVVLQDGASSDTDEGRGMAEIVHDIAPAAHICFSAGGASAATMAQSIRNLRTNTTCDIIADDIYFTDEPFFSDGPISQAIDDVVTSSALQGKKVVYFSAAGNEGNSGYSSDLNLVSATAGKASAVGTLNFTASQPPLGTYTNGFHNFNPGGATRIWTKVTTDSSGTATVVLQWDDPFDTGTVTTDYDFLVFNANGTYNSSLSSTDDNIASGEPIEMSNLAKSTTYYLVIGLSAYSPSPATHLRFISVAGASISGPDIAYSATSMFGHPTAANANGIGAYAYNNGPDTIANYNSGMANPPPGPYRPQLEDFSSNGGNITIYFDNNGNRLATPSVRQKPELSACDGVDTSFFPAGSGNDYDNDGFPNFFGTSAAAPTAAAIGALILEAAGGPGTQTPDQMRTLMEQSTFPHDLDPNFCQATATNGTATVQVSANGNDTNYSASSPNFFTVTFNGNSGETLNQLVIDLTPTLLVFDESSNGFPLTVGSNPNGVSVSHTLSADNRVLTLTFTNFVPGDSISFGIDRDFSAINADGNSADYLAGADINATIDSGTTLLGAFANQLGKGFTFADGYGLVNAQTAVESVLGPLPPSTSVAANLSTRGLVQTGDNVLIGGFIVQGAASKNVIIRALGPSLTAFGVSNALADPTLELHDQNGTQIAFDDNWQDDSNQAAQIQAANLAPTNASESALAETLSPAGYTAIVRGINNTTGVALFEVYDIDSKPPPSQLINISTRGLVQTGDDVLIGGFIVNGSTPTNVLVRAIGPSLTAFGISNALADPLIELHDSQGNLITSNDNWQQDSLQATQIQATGLAPSSALESALVATLNAGSYTAIVRGANATTGVGLVEVYNLK
jgi:hypothetical protein